MPAGRESRFDLRRLELDGDAHREWVVEKRVEPQNDPGLQMDADDDCGIDSCLVKCDRMVSRPCLLGAEPDLDAMLVAGTVASHQACAAERIDEDAEPFVSLLHAEVERCTRVRACVEHAAAGSLDRVLEECVDVPLPRGTVDAGVRPSRDVMVERHRPRPGLSTLPLPRASVPSTPQVARAPCVLPSRPARLATAAPRCRAGAAGRAASRGL